MKRTAIGLVASVSLLLLSYATAQAAYMAEPGGVHAETGKQKARKHKDNKKGVQAVKAKAKADAKQNKAPAK